MNGIWNEGVAKVKESMRNYFAEHFERKGFQRNTLPKVLTGNNLCAEDRCMLEGKFEIEEIKQAVWNCGLEKCPGPDGFNFFFFRHFWDMLQQDFISLTSFTQIQGWLEVLIPRHYAYP